MPTELDRADMFEGILQNVPYSGNLSIAYIAQRTAVSNVTLVFLELYGKCSKILNFFPLLFLNKMLVFRAEIHIMLDRIANREDPGQTASSEAV